MEPAAEAADILHISWGGIALAEPREEDRHWSTWSINLVCGGPFYGWTSGKEVTFPHTLDFELAGEGRISSVGLDSRVRSEIREDGLPSQTGDGSPVRHFTVLGSTAGPDGPFRTLISGEAEPDALTVVPLPEGTQARWLRLRIDSNAAGGGATRLSELSVYGELTRRGAAGVADVSGVYAHEYGPIILRQDGASIRGSYSDGLGTLRGSIFGRILQLAWCSEQEGSIGQATLVATDGKLYGFWYRPEGKMGSPWNAVRERALTADDLAALPR